MLDKLTEDHTLDVVIRTLVAVPTCRSMSDSTIKVEDDKTNVWEENRHFLHQRIPDEFTA